MAKPRITEQEIVLDLQRVYKKLRQPFGTADYDEHGKYSSSTAVARFGSWSKALQAAKLREAFDKHKKYEKEIQNFDPITAVDAKYEAMKDQLKKRAEEKDRKSYERAKVGTELVIENIQAAIASLKPTIIDVTKHPEPQKTVNKGHCTLWFDISDLQLGTLVEKKKTGGLNEHDWKIFKKKLRIWIENVKDIIARSRKEYTIDGVVIAQLGDMVEGHGIFQGQAYQLQFDVYQQMIYGAEDIAAAYIEIASTFPEYKFHLKEVYGNHGRIGRKGETPSHVNFDSVLYEFLRLRLESSKVSNIKYKRNISWYQMVQVYGWKHLLLHGDKGIGGRWGGKYTVNALEKADAKYQKMLQEVIHYMHMGHFHADASFSDSAGMKVINGNWIGGTEYAQDIVESNTPLQKAYLITPANGIERCFYIHLVKRRDQKPQVEIDKIA